MGESIPHYISALFDSFTTILFHFFNFCKDFLKKNILKEQVSAIPDRKTCQLRKTCQNSFILFWSSTTDKFMRLWPKWLSPPVDSVIWNIYSNFTNTILSKIPGESSSTYQCLDVVWWRDCVRACVLSHFSHVQLFVTLWTIALQAPLSMGFFRQEHWNELLCSAFSSTNLGLPWRSGS